MPLGRVTSSLKQRLGFGQGLAFGFQIDGKVFVGGVYTGMSQPMGDGAKVDSRAQQMNGGAVAAMPLAA